MRLEAKFGVDMYIMGLLNQANAPKNVPSRHPHQDIHPATVEPPHLSPSGQNKTWHAHANHGSPCIIALVSGTVSLPWLSAGF